MKYGHNKKLSRTKLSVAFVEFTLLSVTNIIVIEWNTWIANFVKQLVNKEHVPPYWNDESFNPWMYLLFFQGDLNRVKIVFRCTVNGNLVRRLSTIQCLIQKQRMTIRNFDVINNAGSVYRLRQPCIEFLYMYMRLDHIAYVSYSVEQELMLESVDINSTYNKIHCALPCVCISVMSRILSKSISISIFQYLILFFYCNCERYSRVAMAGKSKYAVALSMHFNRINPSSPKVLSWMDTTKFYVFSFLVSAKAQLYPFWLVCPIFSCIFRRVAPRNTRSAWLDCVP